MCAQPKEEEEQRLQHLIPQLHATVMFGKSLCHLLSINHMKINSLARHHMPQYSFWKHTTRLDRRETKKYLEALYICKLRPLIYDTVPQLQGGQNVDASGIGGSSDDGGSGSGGGAGSSANAQPAQGSS